MRALLCTVFTLFIGLVLHALIVQSQLDTLNTRLQKIEFIVWGAETDF